MARKRPKSCVGLGDFRHLPASRRDGGWPLNPLTQPPLGLAEPLAFHTSSKQVRNSRHNIPAAWGVQPEAASFPSRSGEGLSCDFVLGLCFFL